MKYALPVLAALLLTSPASAMSLEDMSCGGVHPGEWLAEAEVLRTSGARVTWPATTATGVFGISITALSVLGYVESFETPFSNLFGSSDWEGVGVVWSGKNGITSRAEFIDSLEAQACAMAEIESLRASR